MQQIDFQKEFSKLFEIKNSLSQDDYCERLEILIQKSLNILNPNTSLSDTSIQFFDSILNVLPELVVVCSMGGTICYANAGAEKAFKPKKLFGNDIRLLFPKRSQAWVSEMIEQASAIDAYQTSGSAMIGSTEDQCEMDIYCSRIKQDNNCYICVSMRPVSAMKQLLTETIESSQIVQEAHSVARIGFSELHQNSARLTWSKASHQLFDLPETMQPPSKLEDLLPLIHQEDKVKFHEMLTQLLGSDEVVRNEYRIVTRQGSTKYVLFAGKRTVLPDGSIIVRGMHIDMTEERKASIELYESQRKLQLLSNNSNDALLILDSQLQCVYCSSSLLNMLGIDAVSLYNRTFTQFIKPEDVAAFSQILDCQNTNKHKIELEIIRPNGNNCWIECVLSEYNEDSHQLGSFTLLVRDVSEKHRASDFLQLASDIFNNIQTGFYIYKMEDLQNDASLRMIAANSATEKLTGIDSQSIIGKLIDEIFPNLRPKNIPEMFAEVVRTGKSFEMIDFEYNDTKIIQNAFSFKAFSLPNNQLGVSFENVTEQKRAQQQLTESELRLKTYIENSPTAIFIINSHGYCTFANDSAGAILAYDRAVLEGLRFESLLWDKNQDVFSILQDKNSIDTIQLRTSLNKRITARLTTIKLGEDQWLTICSDVTELQQVKDDMQRIYDLSLNLICIVNNQGMILRMNPAFEHLLGYNFQEMSLVPLASFIHPEDRINTEQYMKSQIEQGIVPIKFENRIMCKSGGYKWLAWSVQAIPSEKLIFAIAHDITKAKNTESELTLAKERAEQSDKLKSAFLANMSHEIRTPMNGILGFARLLNQENLAKEQRSKYVNIINKSSNQLLTIISDIIDISKIEAGLLQVSEKQVSVNQIMDELHSQFLLELKTAHKEHIVLNMSGNLPEEEDQIITDEVRLKQVLGNLLHNAIKFTKEGSISFGCTIMSTGLLQFYVHDTGIGIEEEKQQSIFERFIQIEHFSNKAIGGTGLGLAISRGIVELFSGRIYVESSYGNGARFVFEIPMRTPKVDLPYRNYPILNITPQTNWSNKTILIVDDMEVIHEFFNEVLLTTQATIIRVKRGKEAVSVFNKKHEDISVVLLDIQLPDMSGLTVAQMMRTINPKVPLIAQTAFAQSGDRETYLNAGFDDYLSKPISIDLLLNMLAKYL